MLKSKHFLFFCFFFLYLLNIFFLVLNTFLNITGYQITFNKQEHSSIPIKTGLREKTRNKIPFTVAGKELEVKDLKISTTTTSYGKEMEYLSLWIARNNTVQMEIPSKNAIWYILIKYPQTQLLLLGEAAQGTQTSNNTTASTWSPPKVSQTPGLAKLLKNPNFGLRNGQWKKIKFRLLSF